jgi:hypothetical protein
MSKANFGNGGIVCMPINDESDLKAGEGRMID